jgi:L-ribulokinase
MMLDSSQDAVVVGVDFGPLSGRAVDVRVRDDAEPGSAVHPDAHAVVERTLPATGRQLLPDRALQTPSVDRIAGATPVPAGRTGLLA